MKNIIIILVIIIVIGGIISIVNCLNIFKKTSKIVVIEQAENNNSNIGKEEINTNLISRIYIEKSYSLGNDTQTSITLNQEEVKIMCQILNNLDFKKETCDGFYDYSVILYNKKDEVYKNYGIETYTNCYHITSKEKGEAELNFEQSKTLSNLINKYFDL